MNNFFHDHGYTCEANNHYTKKLYDINNNLCHTYTYIVLFGIHNTIQIIENIQEYQYANMINIYRYVNQDDLMATINLR